MANVLETNQNTIETSSYELCVCVCLNETMWWWRLLKAVYLVPLLVVLVSAFNSVSYLVDAADVATVDTMELVKDIPLLGDVVEALQLKEDLVLFISFNNQTQKRELWATDGSSDGTIPLLQPSTDATTTTNSDNTNSNGNILFINAEPSWYLQAVLNEKVVFQATTEEWGSEPWVSDGTVRGTRLIKDLNPGPGDSRPQGIVATDEMIYFTAYRDGKFFGENGQLWRTDGTAENTILLRDGDVSTSSVRVIDKENSLALFRTSYSRLIWVTDGTIEGTKSIQQFGDICLSASWAPNLVFDGGKLYFNCNDEAWVTDGTTEGTFKMINNTFIRMFGMGGDSIVNDWFLFGASNDVEDRSGKIQYVYATKGTRDTTNLLWDAGEPDYISFYGAFLPPDDSNFLFAVEGQLIRTDGTVSGTTTDGMMDISPNSEDTVPLYMFRVGDRIVIVRFLPDMDGFEFYSTTDGTQESTKLITTLYADDPGGRRLAKLHQFPNPNNNGPMIWIFEAPPHVNSTNNIELSNFELVLGQSSSDGTVGIVKIGNVNAAAYSFGFRVPLHSSIVSLNGETALLLTTDGQSLKLHKIALPTAGSSSSNAAYISTTLAVFLWLFLTVFVSRP